MDTLDGKDSLHLTCDIAYQIRPLLNEHCSVPIFNADRTCSSQINWSETPPYYKKLEEASLDIKLSAECSSETVIKSNSPNDLYHVMQSIYNKPMLLHQWLNQRFFVEVLPRQKIVYMAPILSPITSTKW